MQLRLNNKGAFQAFDGGCGVQVSDIQCGKPPLAEAAASELLSLLAAQLASPPGLSWKALATLAQAGAAVLRCSGLARWARRVAAILDLICCPTLRPCPQSCRSLVVVVLFLLSASSFSCCPTLRSCVAGGGGALPANLGVVRSKGAHRPPLPALLSLQVSGQPAV